MTHEEEIATIMAIGERRIAGIDKAVHLLYRYQQYGARR